MQEWNRFTSSSYIPATSKLIAKKKVLTASSKLHLHEFYEIELILSGTGDCVLNGKPIQMEPGALFFLSPADLHSVVPTPKMELINIMFEGTWIDDALYNSITSLNSHFIILTDEIQQRFMILCEILIEESQGNSFLSGVYTEMMLKCIIIEIVRQLSSSNISPENIDPVRKAMHFVEIHFREQMKLSDIASCVFLSSTYLSTLFHGSVGITINEYITQVRLNHACSLLRFSDFSITQTCFSCGFNSLSNFFRLFKKRFSMTPADYRKNEIKKLESSR